MLKPRIIPSLLIRSKGLVKTEKFKNERYIGDPLNAVRIFNEKNVDELAIFDIDSTVKSEEPNYGLIEKIAKECRMPLCYGGGIKNKEQAYRIFSLGVEKIAISSALIQNPSLIPQIADSVGSQSVVAVLDVKKKRFGGYEVFTHNGTTSTGKTPLELAKQYEKFGVGEIIINSIDKDGTMQGFDLSLIEIIHGAISIPITALGGCGNLNHIQELIDKFGIIGCGSGSNFIFKGPLKGVLINYPDRNEKNNLLK